MSESEEEEGGSSTDSLNSNEEMKQRTVVKLCWKYVSLNPYPIIVISKDGKVWHGDERDYADHNADDSGDNSYFFTVYNSISSQLRDDLETWFTSFNPTFQDLPTCDNDFFPESYRYTGNPHYQRQRSFLERAEELLQKLKDEIEDDETLVTSKVRYVKRLRLMNEYGACWPLWNYDGDPEEYIYADLKQRLKEWANFFDNNYHFEKGWKASREKVEAYFKEERELTWMLNEQLDADPEVDWYVWWDLWETQNCDNT